MKKILLDELKHKHKHIVNDFLSDFENFGEDIYSITFHCTKYFDILCLERTVRHAGSLQYYVFTTFAIDKLKDTRFHFYLSSDTYVLSDAINIIREMMLAGIIFSYSKCIVKNKRED